MHDVSIPITLFGHRGARGEAPENTMLGFEYAWHIGVRAFELDVQLSKDDQLVVIHDPTLDRTTSVIGRVIDHTSGEMKAMNACLGFPVESKSGGVPLLDEVLKDYKGQLEEWQIEIKTNEPANLRLICERVRDSIAKYELEEKVTVTSFDPIALRFMREFSPSQSLGLIQDQYTNPDIKLALSLDCKNICIPLQKCNSSIVNLAHSSGLNVTGWLGNNSLEISALLNSGVDSITTDMPSVARNYLFWYFQSSN